MTTWLAQLRVLTVKELRQLWRDRSLAAFIVYIFTLDIMIAAGAGSWDLRDVRVLVHDRDGSVASRELVSQLRPPFVDLVGEAAAPADVLDRLDRGEVTAVIDIPAGFGRTLARGDETARVQVLIDASRPIRGYLTTAYLNRIVEGYSASFAARRLDGGGAAAAIRHEPRLWYNPNLEPSWFLTISELLTMMTVACVVLPGAALVRERERGTLEQLLVSPLTPFQMMFGKVLAMVIVTLAGTSLAVFGLMQPLFGVPVRGSVLLFLLLTSLYAFTNAGLGLVAATFARSSARLGMIVLLLVTPIIMLSGTWVTIESMPAGLRAATMLSPLRHFIEIAYGILLRGSGVVDLWRPILWMAALGAVLFCSGLWRFRRQALRA